MYLYKLLNVFVCGTPFSNLHKLCYQFEADLNKTTHRLNLETDRIPLRHGKDKFSIVLMAITSYSTTYKL